MEDHVNPTYIPTMYKPMVTFGVCPADVSDGPRRSERIAMESAVAASGSGDTMQDE